MAKLPEKPLTRDEQYLAEIAGVGQGYPEKPLTRKEQYYTQIIENGGTGGGGEGVSYIFGHGLKQSGRTVSVDIYSDGGADKTLPVSAAIVENAVGNIEVLLKSI